PALQAPIGTARHQATAVAATVRRSVLAARSRRRGPTGRSYSSEKPISPRATDWTQRQYRTDTPSSRPYRSRRLASAEAEMAGLSIKTRKKPAGKRGEKKKKKKKPRQEDEA